MYTCYLCLQRNNRAQRNGYRFLGDGDYDPCFFVTNVGL